MSDRLAPIAVREYGERSAPRVAVLHGGPGAPGSVASCRSPWRSTWTISRGCCRPRAFTAIGARVLMIHGDEDPHPGAAIRDTLRRFLPQLKYVGIPRCGHLPWLERDGREPCLRALRSWLRGADGRET